MGALRPSGRWSKCTKLTWPYLIGTSIPSTVEVYDPILGRWRDAEAMSMLRSRVGVAVMQNRLYAIGGYNGQERLNTVEVFDAVTKRWSKVAAMNCKRSAVRLKLQFLVLNPLFRWAQLPWATTCTSAAASMESPAWTRWNGSILRKTAGQ